MKFKHRSEYELAWDVVISLMQGVPKQEHRAQIVQKAMRTYGECPENRKPKLKELVTFTGVSKDENGKGYIWENGVIVGYQG